MPTFTGSLSHYGACTAEVWGLTLLFATRGRVGSLWIANKLPESRNIAFTVGNSMFKSSGLSWVSRIVVKLMKYSLVRNRILEHLPSPPIPTIPPLR